MEQPSSDVRIVADDIRRRHLELFGSSALRQLEQRGTALFSEEDAGSVSLAEVNGYRCAGFGLVVFAPLWFFFGVFLAHVDSAAAARL